MAREEEDIFEGGIDLNLIADSEEGVFEVDTTIAPPDKENKSSDKGSDKKEFFDKDEDEDNEDNEEGLSLEDLANLGEDDEEEEEDKVSLDKDKKTKTPADKEQASSSADTLTSLAKALKDAGVFSSLEEEDLEGVKDVESLMKAVEKQIKVNEYSFLTEDQKEYLKALENGIPTEAYSQVKSNAKQYEDLSDEVIEKNANVTYELLRRKYIIDGAEPEKAKRLATLSMKDENAIEEAKEAKVALIEYENNLIKEEIARKQEEREDLVKSEQEKIKELRSKVLEKDDLVSGIKLNAQTRDRIFSSLTSPVKDGKDGMPLNEVMDKYESDDDYKLKLHAFHVITKGFTDFSKLEKTNKSKAIKELEEKLQNSEGFKAGSTQSVAGRTSGSMAKALESYKPFKRN